MTIAVVGCGYWGKNLVRNFAELGVLSAVCDRDEALVRAAAEATGAAIAEFADVVADPSIEGVVIAAPAAQHHLLAAEALGGGKHVFVEKPLALEVAAAEALCIQAERGDRVLMVGHLLQYHAAYLELKRLVETGVLGRLQYVYSNRLNFGKIRREENILWSFAPHDISMILGLVGSEPDAVWGVGAPYLHKSIADVTTTHLSFPGGERAHVFVSWLHPFKEQKLVVVGDQAMAVFDDGEPWERKLLLYRHRVDWRGHLPEPIKAEGEAVELTPHEPLRSECLHFLDCIATGATPRTDGREGVRVLRVLREAERAMAGDGVPTERRRRPPAVPDAISPTHPGVHPTAVLDDDVILGEGTRIWHFSHVLTGSRIGRGCSLGQNVVVGPKVTIGDGCKIQNNVSVFEGVTLEDAVFCGPSCVFTNVINPRSEIERKTEFRPTLVRRGATIGANATIICGATLGEYCFVAAGAVVTRDVPDFALVVGSPARQVGWMSHAGDRLGDDLVCPSTGRRYRLATKDRLEEVVGG